MNHLQLDPFFRNLFVAICIGMIGIQGSTFAATGSVDAGETHQTLEGFGASAYYYDNWLTAHPNKEDICFYIFEELGLDILRLGNVYGYQSGSLAPNSEEIVQMAEDFRGYPIKVMISSWSPPAYLKSNNNKNNGGTLVKINGAYAYAEYAHYWLKSLAAYQEIGIVPQYISIQNEPDFSASYESCVFRETETTSDAGYGNALDAVYDSLQTWASHPQIIGPEVLGIGYNEFQKYAQRLNRNHLNGYAYHLYHGESDNVNDNHNPDLFISNLSAIAKAYPDKPIFQTEYDRGDWFNTAWLMHNALVSGNVSGYFYWGLFWDVQTGHPLVALENPWNKNAWNTPEGYTITDSYWAFRQFSKFIKPGWKRVTSTVSSTSIKLSAFLSAKCDSLTVVALNVGTAAQELTLTFRNYRIEDGEIIRTSADERGETVGSFNASTLLNLPARSITTLVITGQEVDAVEETITRPETLILEQNFPNPFNPKTVIHYRIPEVTLVRLSVYDMQGREIVRLVDQVQKTGEHQVCWDGSHFPSGTYFYKLQAGTHSKIRKMAFIK